MGEREYVVFTAIGTAAMLLLLAVGPPPLAVGCYLACLTLQYMNEPSLFALLMNRVSEVQRSGASSLMFITMSIAGTVAAAVAGGAIVRLGYSTCLFVAAIIAVIAALLFSRVPDLASGLHNDNN
jgi:predicted MFS family arabinose efflux permease